MTETEQKRAYLASLYPGPKWKRRVEKMSDGQVIAIYLTEKRREEKPNEKEKSDDGIF